MRTGGAAGDLGAAAVRLGDRAHDRQAEPGAAAGAGLVAAGEALERAPGQLRREARALVGDLELDRAGRRARAAA